VRIEALAASLAAGILAGGCAPAPPTPWAWDLPDYLPAVPLPDGESVTVEKVELGRALFYETRLSGNQTQSCASCHIQRLGFADPRPTPVGSTGVPLARNGMALANLAWLSSYTWPNPTLTTLEDQALVPLVGDTPPELDAGSDLDRVLADLSGDPYYGEAFPAAFPELEDPFGVSPIVRALAAFQRTMIALDSPYDRWLRGDPDALSEQALRGLALFESDDLRCAECHGGPLQTNAALDLDRDEVFFNTGLYEEYPPDAPGLFEVTTVAADVGRFRVPSLRNVALTGPWFHDGSGQSLDEVLDHYARGGRVVQDGPWAGDGRDNPNRSSRVSGFALPEEDRAALLAFLGALTDPGYGLDEAFAAP
jgi:cytochrome c peroxidase